MGQTDCQWVAFSCCQQIDRLVSQADGKLHLLAAGDLAAQPEVHRDHDLSRIGLGQEIQAQCASLHVDVAGKAVEGFAQICSVPRRHCDRSQDAQILAVEQAQAEIGADQFVCGIFEQLDESTMGYVDIGPLKLSGVEPRSLQKT